MTLKRLKKRRTKSESSVMAMLKNLGFNINILCQIWYSQHMCVERDVIVFVF